MARIDRELWRERLDLPAYQVGEAARYARTTPQTIRNWQKPQHVPALSERETGRGLSYLQLIEVGVVAAMRKAGIKLKKVRAARNFLQEAFDEEYPFARYRFKTDGKEILADHDQFRGGKNDSNLIVVSENGQLAWHEIIGGLLQEFHYEPEGDIVISWRVAGVDSPIIIDPRIAFGAPAISGIPTRIVADRYRVGEEDDVIADDYNLRVSEVRSALAFEGVAH